MKRYVSIDFLRGLAIFIMIYLHTFKFWFNDSEFIDTVFNQGVPLFLVLLFVVMLFFGGWAGFFLMVSAMGNMISMYKGLEKGLSAKDLVIKQVIGGFLLLAFAYLCEGVIGYQGAIGRLLRGDEDWLDVVWHRGYIMETIHAVAWCVILNGVVQGLLSMNDGWKKIDRNIKIYAILAVIVVAATQFVWWSFDALVDGNFSLGTDPRTGQGWQRGHLLKLDFTTNLLRVFWQPWAGVEEPVFPFLTVSFIGSIVSLHLLKRKYDNEKRDTTGIRKGMAIASVMVFIGLISTLVHMLTAHVDPVDYLLNLHASPPRLEELYPTRVLVFGKAIEFSLVWVPGFLLLTGSQLGAILLTLRLVEFRGKGKEFADKTLFFRRFGFVAFSAYTYQFVDVIPVFLLTLIPGIPAYSMGIFNTTTIWFAVILIFLLWYVIFEFWEKIDYAFGLEWCIAKISKVLMPSKRREDYGKLQWWKTRRLDPGASLHNAEWIDIIPADKIDHESLKESRLSQKLALCGIIFFPCFILAINIANSSKKIEGVNKYNRRGKFIGLIGIIIFVSIMVVTFFLPSSLLF